MQKAPILNNEKDRLLVLSRMGLLDNLKQEERFDRFTKMAVEKLNVPISTITILDENKEYYKSREGIVSTEGDRSTSFCGHAIASEVMFIIPDCTKDLRFADNPAVIGPPFIRFYAGMALYDYSSGMAIGVFCVKDTKPRNFSLQETEVFMSIAEMVEKELNTPNQNGK